MSEAHVLPPLPYSEGALEAVISAETVRLYYRKHHLGYVDKLNSLVANTPYADLPLTKIIAQRQCAGRKGNLQ